MCWINSNGTSTQSLQIEIYARDQKKSNFLQQFMDVQTSVNYFFKASTRWKAYSLVHSIQHVSFTTAWRTEEWQADAYCEWVKQFSFRGHQTDATGQQSLGLLHNAVATARQFHVSRSSCSQQALCQVCRQTAKKHQIYHPRQKKEEKKKKKIVHSVNDPTNHPGLSEFVVWLYLKRIWSVSDSLLLKVPQLFGMTAFVTFLHASLLAL